MSSLAGHKGSSNSSASASNFHKKRGEEAFAEIVIEGAGEPAVRDPPQPAQPSARKTEVPARKELPLILRQIADTTRDTLRRETQQSFSEEQEYLRGYIDRQMNSYFKEQLNVLKLQLSDFIKDFVEVRNTEIVNESISRESVKTENELREMQSVLDGLQQGLSQLVGEGEKSSGFSETAQRAAERMLPGLAAVNTAREDDALLAELSAQNEELKSMVATQRQQISELQRTLSSVVEGELNGFFGEDINFSIIKQKKDDTLAEEWLPSEMKLLPSDGTPKQTTTNLNTKAPIVSLTGPASPGDLYSFLATGTEKTAQSAALPLKVSRERLESVQKLFVSDHVQEKEFIIDANGILTDLESNPIIDDNGNLIKVTSATVKEIISSSSQPFV